MREERKRRRPSRPFSGGRRLALARFRKWENRRRVGEGRREIVARSLPLSQLSRRRTAHFDPRLCNLDDAMDVMVSQPPSPAHARTHCRRADSQFEAVKVMPPACPTKLYSVLLCLRWRAKCRIIAPFRGGSLSLSSSSAGGEKIYLPICTNYMLQLSSRSYVMRKRSG